MIHKTCTICFLLCKTYKCIGNEKLFCYNLAEAGGNDMNRSIMMSICIALLVLVSGCSGNDAQKDTNTYETISAEAAKEKMDQGNVIIVDVRTKEEYEEGHIKDAINIPLDDIDQAGDQLKKSDTILVYCRSGNRSAQAARKLSESNYEHIYDFGGITNWPYEIIK